MESTVIPVSLPQNAYQILIAPGQLSHLGDRLQSSDCIRGTLGSKMLIVSNPQIWKHYGELLVQTLTQAGFQVDFLLLPAGERYKTLKSLQKIYDAALRHRLERSSTLIALGGGVIGDMTGFAAATWLRGIAVIQVPTSLLAMVDAAIGGKTGVNHPQGKNLIGAFHQPRLVVIDPQTLKTLPAREFRAAMAEVIKYGVIWDAQLFAQLEQCPRLDRYRDLSEAQLAEILQRSCQAKADVVSKDEKEAGLRAILNYGHTIGHAIESLTGYRQFNHGEAVGLGMIAAGQISVALGLWSAQGLERQQQLIQGAGLPTHLPTELDPNAVLELLQTDKKVAGGRVRFVLPTGIGTATLSDQVPPEVIRAVLSHMQA
ncbi:3-dehydroquinate synthase [Synechococcales cyanobacterium C]|uniref:3-dehydroquinate synthase n=1 Tax=Petrachloros mirabilis ULC683 TaxID=2781853 RepID=A0A8K1ZZ67_9CYAN|nr:3-dehydroquinate synthase [Petrachloros mirabilis]NCJ07859.1 3-dehydroquinate synthase [Petrachloros mirabilis ULC683]